MSESLINDATMTGIANAIRSKNGLTVTYTPTGMIQAINSLVTTTPNLQNKSVNPATSTVTVTADSGYTGLGKVTVAAARLQQKSYTPTTTLRTVSPDSGYYGLSGIVVNPIPSSYIIPSDTIDISSNGTVDVSHYAYASVSVPSGGITPTGTLSISSNGTYDVTNYASASVSVSGGGGITPTGVITITQNGVTNVTTYADANVNVHDFDHYVSLDFQDGICSASHSDLQSWLYNYDTICANLNDQYDTINVYCADPTDQSEFVYFFYALSTNYEGDLTYLVAAVEDDDSVEYWLFTYTDADYRQF